MKANLLDRLLSLRASKVPCAMVTELTGGAQSLVALESAQGDLALTDTELKNVHQAIADDWAGILNDEAGGNRRLFVHVFNPPLRMIIVGAVHIAQPLAPMAQLAGYDVIIIDPRQSFATEARFPDVRLVDEWPDDALAALSPDPRTAIVTLTHDPKLDDPALLVALRSPAFYIGCLGSTRTHAKRVQRLKDVGFTDHEIARLDAPIGLSIGAKSPAEIAVSILAEITRVRRRAPALQSVATEI